MQPLVTLNSSATNFYGVNNFYYPIRLSIPLSSGIQLLGGVSLGLRYSVLVYSDCLELHFEITPLWNTSPQPFSSRNLSMIMFGY